ncbi:acetyltransferase [Bacillus pseudomycoides]|nr:acetyltransferase [Bacillus pseudomycoides]
MLVYFLGSLSKIGNIWMCVQRYVFSVAILDTIEIFSSTPTEVPFLKHVQDIVQDEII